VPDLEPPLLHFVFLPSCLQTSIISGIVAYRQIFRLSCVGIAHASSSSYFLLCYKLLCVLFALFHFEKVS
jgi:hypothetical protein